MDTTDYNWGQDGKIDCDFGSYTHFLSWDSRETDCSKVSVTHCLEADWHNMMGTFSQLGEEHTVEDFGDTSEAFWGLNTVDSSHNCRWPVNMTSLNTIVCTSASEITHPTNGSMSLRRGQFEGRIRVPSHAMHTVACVPPTSAANTLINTDAWHILGLESNYLL